MTHTRRTALVLAIALGGTGCYDFVEPDFPEAGAAALFQFAAFADEAGVVTINALLAPGLTEAGVQRRVLQDTIEVYGLELAPAQIRRNGTREYSLSQVTDGGALDAVPLEVQAPRVEDVTAPPPAVRWFPIRKVGPDTIIWQRGTDLVLRVQTDLGTSQPLPPIRQWFLDLRSRENSFRLSSDGLPPNTIVIPSIWVPAADEGEAIAVSLQFYQSGQQQTGARDYIGLFSFNFQLQWVVHVIS